jgi:hypothetical protein
MAFNPPKKAARPDLQSMMIAIQTAMQERKLDTKGLCDALGVPVEKRPAVYNWITGKNGPSEVYRAKLSKILGLTEAQLTAATKSKPRTKQLLGPAQRAVALAQQAGPSPSAMPTEPVRDVFSITGRSDGQISVQLQATLDASRGMALARFLMDFGLIIGDHNVESE